MKQDDAPGLRQYEHEILRARSTADFDTMLTAAKALQTYAEELCGKASLFTIKGLLFEVEASLFRYRADASKIGDAIKKIAEATDLLRTAAPSHHSLFVDVALLNAEAHRILNCPDDAFGLVLTMSKRIPLPGYPLPGSLASAAVQRLYAGLTAYSNTRAEEAVSFFESIRHRNQVKREHPALLWYGLLTLASLDVTNDNVEDAREIAREAEALAQELPDYITVPAEVQKQRMLADVAILDSEYDAASTAVQNILTLHLATASFDDIERDALHLFSSYQRQRASGQLLYVIKETILPNLLERDDAPVPLIGMCYEWAGESCLSLQRFEEAVEHFSQACDYYKKAETVDDSTLAHALHNLGALKLTLNEAREAESLLTEALTIRQRYYGQSHPEVAKTMSALGVAQQKLGRTGEAMRLFELLIDSFSYSLSDDHPAIRQARFFLEQINNPQKPTDSSGDTDEASDPGETQGTPLNPATMFNEAMMHFHSRNYSKAVIQFEELIKIIGESQGEQHPDIIPLLETLAGVYTEMGLAKKATACKEQADEIKATLN